MHVHKHNPREIKGVFLSYSSIQKCYKCFDFITGDITFQKHIHYFFVRTPQYSVMRNVRTFLKSVHIVLRANSIEKDKDEKYICKWGIE